MTTAITPGARSAAEPSTDLMRPSSPSPVGWEFFRQSKSAPDQLRLRMAHVWHQIFVIGDAHGTYAYADFHQRLRDNVFGTFEDLLVKYALSPQLGEFQNVLVDSSLIPAGPTGDDQIPDRHVTPLPTFDALMVQLNPRSYQAQCARTITAESYWNSGSGRYISFPSACSSVG